MPDHKPCLCDSCLTARESELARARNATLEIVADFVDQLGADTEQLWPPRKIAFEILKLKP